MNTKILEREYDYIAPTTMDEAIEVLAGNRPVKILAGGTDLVVKLKMGADFPMEVMMDIKHIPELDDIRDCECGRLRIGAATVLSKLELSEVIRDRYFALHEALLAMASPSVRNMATIGGNICNASPVADCIGPLICYGTTLFLRSKTGERQFEIENFFVAPGVTRANPDELLTFVGIKPQPEHTGAAFLKLGRVKADIAKISVTVRITRDGNNIADCRIALGSVAATPLYLREISESLTGKEFTDELARATAARVADSITPITDSRTTAEYRKDMARLMVYETMEKAWDRSFE